MRKKSFICSLLMLLLAVMIAAIAGCAPEDGGGGGAKPPKITEGDVCIGMEITKMPTKTEYKHGEKFNPAGLVFDAVYENGFDGDKNLNAGDLDGWAPTGPLNADVTEVILKFEGFEKVIPIKVVAKKLKGIEIAREPDIKAYSVGDALDLTGLTVKAEYEEGTIDSEGGFVVTDKDGKKYEQGTVVENAVKDLELTVTLTVGGITASDIFTIHVDTLIKVQAEDVIADGAEVPHDKSYTVVTGKKPSEVIKNDCTFTGTGYLGNISKGVTVDFYIYAETFIKNADLVLMASSTRLDNDNKTMMDCRFNKLYRVFIGEGENAEEVFIGDDIIIEGKPFPSADSGSSKWTNWADVPFGSIELKPGFNKVSVRCIGSEKDADGKNDRTPNIDRLDVRLSATPDAPAKGDECTDIVIKTMPSKLAYKAGEKFSADGIIFDAVYNNGYEGDKNLTAARLTWEPAGVLTTADTLVTLKFKGIEKTINITVAKKTLTAVEIMREPDKNEYAMGEALDLGGLVVKAAYVEGDDLDAKNYVVTDGAGKVYTNGAVLNTAGPLTLTVGVTVDGVTKTDTFTVNVRAAITVQAEAVLSAGETAPTDRSYTVISGEHKVKIEAGNGATSVSDIDKGNKIDFYVYSEKEVKGATLILTAASLDRGNNKTNDTQFNKIFKLAVDDADKTVADEVVIAGRALEEGERIWFLWTDNMIANVDLKAGYTKISLECIGKITDSGDKSQRAANIDKIEIKF